MICLDIGCGSNKRPSFLGIDKLDLPGVDFVLELETEALPFEDHSVSHIYSSHCLEHLKDPTHIFSEFGRVCKDGASIELWTPYAFSNGAFVPDHKFFFAEDIYFHICCWYREFWHSILKSYWTLNQIAYVCPQETMKSLAQQGIPAGFAIRYFKDICPEFGVFMTVTHNEPHNVPAFPRYVACTREGVKIEISNWWGVLEDDGMDYMKFHREAKRDSFLRALYFPRSTGNSDN